MCDNSYTVTNVVSSVNGQAPVFNPNLINAWGLARSATSPWWVSSAGTGSEVILQANGNNPLTVTIPPNALGDPASPTGIVFNQTSDFLVDGIPATFIFASENGTIAAWRSGLIPFSEAQIVVDRSNVGAVYKSITIGSVNGVNYLYATNFHQGTVEVFDAEFNLLFTFTDPCLAAEPLGDNQFFVPFNIQNLDPIGTTEPSDHLYVTFALQDPEHQDDVDGRNLGYVVVFDTRGNVVKRLVKRCHLNSPWGLARAPDNFGRFSGALLVANFGSGTISAFDRCGEFLGRLRNADGTDLIIDGLRGIAFGGGIDLPDNGDTNQLFFAAGPALETQGLFGYITAN